MVGGLIEPAGWSWEPGFRGAVDNDCHLDVVVPRMGVMVHYDGSASDLGAESWIRDERFRMSYNALVLDDGSWMVAGAPFDRAAWHAGWCIPSSERFPYSYPKRSGTQYRHPWGPANSAFYGVSIAATDGDRATWEQTQGVAWIIAALFEREGWDPVAEGWRVTGHDREAAFPPGHSRAGQRGRKIDPTGSDPSNPVLSLDELRDLVRFNGEVHAA